MQYDNDKLSDLYEKHSKNPFLGEKYTINENDTLVKAISKILLKMFGFGLIITIPLLLLFYIFIEILSIEPGILFVGLTIILYMYFILYLYYFSKKNFEEYGRTIFKIKVLHNEKTDLLIKRILKKLYYKEEKYNKEYVYHSKKSKFDSTRSVHRYLKYNVFDEYIEITCWYKILGKEFKIDNAKFRRLAHLNVLYLIMDIIGIRDVLNDYEAIESLLNEL